MPVHNSDAMSATVRLYWPGIRREQAESHDEMTAWGNWMAEREEPAVLEAVRALGAEAILTFKTDGDDDEDVEWVSPAQLREAATRLKRAVRAQDPQTAVILENYARNAHDRAPVADQFVQDLELIETITRFAEGEGATQMTLEVNW
jgi:hypothetical protein